MTVTKNTHTSTTFTVNEDEWKPDLKNVFNHAGFCSYGAKASGEHGLLAGFEVVVSVRDILDRIQPQTINKRGSTHQKNEHKPQ